MKRISLTLLLGVFLVGLTAPLISKAQPTLQECCKLGHNIEVKSGKLPATITTAACVDNAAGSACTKSDSCIFQKDCTLGQKVETICARPNKAKVVDVKVDVAFEMWGLVCILNVIYTVTNWLFYILLLIAVLMTVIGGFFYMTAAGDPNQASKGKSVIIFAMIGFAIALLSRAIPSLIRGVMGM